MARSSSTAGTGLSSRMRSTWRTSTTSTPTPSATRCAVASVAITPSLSVKYELFCVFCWFCSCTAASAGSTSAGSDFLNPFRLLMRACCHEVIFHMSSCSLARVGPGHCHVPALTRGLWSVSVRCPLFQKCKIFNSGPLSFLQFEHIPHLAVNRAAVCALSALFEPFPLRGRRPSARRRAKTGPFSSSATFIWLYRLRCRPLSRVLLTMLHRMRRLFARWRPRTGRSPSAPPSR